MSFYELLSFFYATGIMGLLARMCVDVHDIKKVFDDMKDALEKMKATLLDHDQRINKLEKQKEKEHERLA